MEFKRGDIGLFFRGDPTLVFWLPLNGNAADYEQNHSTSFIGSPAVVPLDRNAFERGLGYNFEQSDGSYQIIQIANAFTNGQPKGTAMVWFTINSTADTAETRIFQQHNVAVWSIIYNSDGLNAHIYDGAHKTTSSSLTLPIGKNRIGCAVITWDSSNLKLYYNGKYITQVAAGAPYYSSADTSINIAGHNDGLYSSDHGGGYWLKGKVAEAAYWKRDLSLAEISQYYNWATGKDRKWYSLYYEAPATSNALFFGNNF